MNVVASVLLTSIPNPMCPGCDNYRADPEIFRTWFESLVDCKGVILADQLGEEAFQTVIDWRHPDASFELGVSRVTDKNLFMQRWELLYQWLVNSPATDWVWFTDCSDVTMLNPPWPHMRAGVLYVGSEVDHTVSLKWIVDNHPSIRPLAKRSPNRPLANAGLLGGDRMTVLNFVDRLIWRCDDCEDDLTDMGAFNLVLADDWDGHVETGRPVHTEFNAWVHRDRDCWFAHK